MLLPRQLVLRLYKQQSFSNLVAQQLADLRSILSLNPGQAAWLVEKKEQILQALTEEQRESFAFVDPTGKLIAGKATQREVVLLEVSNAKRILGYNFAGIVYQYSPVNSQAEQESGKSIHAHNLLYCLATVKASGVFCLYSHNNFAPNSYPAYVLETAKNFARLSQQLNPKLEKEFACQYGQYLDFTSTSEQELDHQESNKTNKVTIVEQTLVKDTLLNSQEVNTRLTNFWQEQKNPQLLQEQAQKAYQAQLEIITAQIKEHLTQSNQALELKQKQVYAFLGQRGAGKTHFSLELAQQFPGQVAITALGKRTTYGDLPYLAPEVAVAYHQPDELQKSKQRDQQISQLISQQAQKKQQEASNNLVEENPLQILLVDEASAFSASVLQELLHSSWQVIIFVSTIDGYESGAGVGLWHRVIARSPRPVKVYHFNWSFRALEPDILSAWQEQLSGTTSLATLLQSNPEVEIIPIISNFANLPKQPKLPKQDHNLLPVANKLKQQVTQQSNLQHQGNLQEQDYTICKLETFAAKLEFFQLAYLTHYRHQVQDFASAFSSEQELYGLYFQDKLIGGIHLIKENYPEELAKDILAGRRLPPGNLGVQTLIQYFGLQAQLKEKKITRVSRIFLLPTYRHLGLAQKLLSSTTTEQQLVLTMYSQDQEIESFWQSAGFSNLCYLPNPNKSTGKGNVLSGKVQDASLDSWYKGISQLYQLCHHIGQGESEQTTWQTWQQSYPELAQSLLDFYQLWQEGHDNLAPVYIKDYRLFYARLYVQNFVNKEKI
ncbi:hypothetical protein CKF54_07470 [Psittacicella hinzii]|uniref:AAA+ ATPase domain-containing protein n=1 Tax=Psittacicella hinzii TaxID=2028575 RepID=A0A3A1Y1H8_9GAMM|nr:hypothetical protein [Psittacicella hinzii]RIY31136.1 hypothetical protein CKF54_07470 [Psittacicella hinzii]